MNGNAHNEDDRQQTFSFRICSLRPRHVAMTENLIPFTSVCFASIHILERNWRLRFRQILEHAGLLNTTLVDHGLITLSEQKKNYDGCSYCVGFGFIKIIPIRLTADVERG